MAALAVETIGLSRRYGRRWALADVSLGVPEGAVVMLAGRNGSGKSTLLRVLATALRPDHGSVRIAGHDSRRELARVRASVALLGHQSYLYEALSARENLEVARQPAVLPVGARSRVLVFAFGASSSGIPPEWAAGVDTPGVDFLPDLSRTTARRIGEQVRAVKREGDITVASIHWGGNWGYEVPPEQRAFAHALLEEAGVDVLHGHSSHHPKGFEIHHGRLILYGCGDLINDYEGIEGHEGFRSELTLLYFPELDDEGRLSRLQLAPVRLRHLRLEAPSAHDRQWLRDTLERECAELGNPGRLVESDAGVWEWRGEP